MESKSLFRGYHFPMQVYEENYKNGGFTQLSLDLSSRCNYDCDWCFNKHLLNKREPDILNLNEKESLLEQAASLGVKTLVIPGTGEPTLDHDFYPLTAIASKLGLTTVVYTNLTGNIDKEKIKLLHERDVSIGIKMDSFNPDYFQKRYHASNNSFSRFKSNLDAVLETYLEPKQKEGNNIVYRTIANMVLTREN